MGGNSSVSKRHVPKHVPSNDSRRNLRALFTRVQVVRPPLPAQLTPVSLPPFVLSATDVCFSSCSRSFQNRAATEAFEKWSKGGSEEPFSDFKVGFQHPHHLGPIFNMSDPMHILKKIVNALWHSDILGKQRDLGAWLEGEDGEEEQFFHFSLKTAERVFNQIENEGEDLSTEEKAALLSTFRHHSSAIWRRTNHSCMNVSHSAKVPLFFEVAF